jgi:hypothetical protein
MSEVSCSSESEKTSFSICNSLSTLGFWHNSSKQLMLLCVVEDVEASLSSAKEFALFLVAI